MTSPTIDILVPVWNNPFETRACLAAILAHSPGARLIIVDNGSSRETELMLEEFSESLGDQGLFIKSERNIGLIAAINLGLARSDSDYYGHCSSACFRAGRMAGCAGERRRNDRRRNRLAALQWS